MGVVRRGNLFICLPTHSSTLLQMSMWPSEAAGGKYIGISERSTPLFCLMRMHAALPANAPTGAAMVTTCYLFKLFWCSMIVIPPAPCELLFLQVCPMTNA